MKKIGTWVGAAALALVLAGCDVTPGGRCDQEGSKATNKDGTAYTCQSIPREDGKKVRVWVQDGPLTPDRP